MNRFTRGRRHGECEAPLAHHHELGPRPGRRLLPRRQRRRHVRRRLLVAKGSQSDRAMQLLAENFPEAAKGKALVVFAADQGGTTLARTSAARSTAVLSARSPTSTTSRRSPTRSRRGTISADGRIGYAEADPRRARARDGQAGLHRALRRRVARRRRPASASSSAATPSFLNAEDKSTGHVGIGLLVALLVLLVVFGTVVAAVIPIGLSIVAVGAGIGGITLLAGGMDVSASAIPVAGLVGLGVGVDYALFVVARYRENRAAGQDNHRALVRRDGARPVPPSSSPAAPSSSPPPPSPSPGVGVLTSIGLATSIMVLFAVAAAITLLPALLEPARRPHRHRPPGPRVTVRPSAPRTPPGGASATASSARPWPYLLGSRRRPAGHRGPGVRACRPPSRRPATPPPRPPTDRPTTCSPRASAPGSTRRCWSSSTSTPRASTPTASPP